MRSGARASSAYGRRGSVTTRKVTRIAASAMKNANRRRLALEYSMVRAWRVLIATAANTPAMISAEVTNTGKGVPVMSRLRRETWVDGRAAAGPDAECDAMMTERRRTVK